MPRRLYDRGKEYFEKNPAFWIKPPTLPEDATGWYIYIDGHGPFESEVDAERMTLLLNEYRCTVDSCFKCAKLYRRELNYPRGREEADIFV